MFLTRKQIADFTGYHQPVKQIAILKSYGIRFFVAGDGKPRVLRSDLENKHKPRLHNPDFAALKKAG